MLFYFTPAPRADALSSLFLPNEHLFVVRARRQDMTIFRIGPGYSPDGSGVPNGSKLRELSKKFECIPFERMTATSTLSLPIYYVKHFHGAIRWANCEAFSIVVQLTIVLKISEHKEFFPLEKHITTHAHILVGRLDWHWIWSICKRLYTAFSYFISRILRSETYYYADWCLTLVKKRRGYSRSLDYRDLEAPLNSYRQAPVWLGFLLTYVRLHLHLWRPQLEHAVKTSSPVWKYRCSLHPYQHPQIVNTLISLLNVIHIPCNLL